jgi:hypothetical protein
MQFPETPPVEYHPAIALTTRIQHTSGQWQEATMMFPVSAAGNSNQTQSFGAALTYARRYALTSILCIAADEDVDANPIPGNGQDIRGETSPQAQKAREEKRPKASTSGNNWTSYILDTKTHPYFDGQAKHVSAAAKLLGITSANVSEDYAHNVKVTLDYAKLRAVGVTQDDALKELMQEDSDG